MGNDPTQEKLVAFQKAIADIRSTDEAVRLRAIETFGDTIGYLPDTEIESGAMLILDQMLHSTQSDDVKRSIKDAFHKIKDRCETNLSKRDIEFMAFSSLGGFKKKETDKNCLVIGIVIVIVVIIIACIAMGFDFANFMSQ